MTDVSSPAETTTPDWFAEVTQARTAPGGTFETPHGGDPRLRNVLDTPQPPSLRVAAMSGTFDDEGRKVRMLAGNRFPKLPIAEAMERYGVVDGDLVYLGDDGSLYREFPDGMRGWPTKTAEFVASAGPAMAGGAAGGLKFGWPGAAAGAAAGLVVRKGAGAALGDKRDFKTDAMDLAVEASLNALGWKAGDLLGKKVIDRRVASDLGKFDRAKALNLQNVAKRYFGIDVTPAEASELGSLINQQTALGTGLDDAASIIRDYYQKRVGQVNAAVDSFIGKTPHATKAGAELRNVGKQAIADAEAARSTASGPLYKALDRANPMIDERAFTAIESDDLTREYLDKAVSDPKFGVMDQPRNSYRVVDRAGKLMRDEAETLRRTGKSYEASVIDGARDKLLRKMEDVVPGYRDARRAYAQGSEYLDELKQGVEGVLSKLKDTRLHKAADLVFNSQNAGPVQITNARRLFESQGKSKEWDNLLNVWLRQRWESIRDNQGGISLGKGGEWRKRVYGSDQMKNNMRAAMGAPRFERFEALMEVLEATAKVAKGQSQTAGVLANAARERAEAAPLVSGMKIDIADPLGSFNLREWWIEARTGEWRKQIANIITSPNAIPELEKLRKLRALSPDNQKALSLATAAVTKGIAYGGASAIHYRRDKPPAALSGAH